MTKMNSVEEERKERTIERNDLFWFGTHGLFWIERLFLFLLVLFPTYVLDLIFPLLLTTTLSTSIIGFLSPILSSVGPSGIGGTWLFLLDRLTFYLGFEYAKLLAQGSELAFLWRLTVSLSVAIHSIYIVEHLLRSYQAVSPPNHHETPISTEAREIDDEKEKMKELVEELSNDGKKMRTDMEHMIHSSLETLRKEFGGFRDEFSKYGEITMTKVDAMEHMICSQVFRSQLGTLTENMRLNVDEIYGKLRDELISKVNQDIKALREDFNKDVKSVADQLHETYLVIQETSKEVKTVAHENKRRMIRGEDVEGFAELKEEVQRISMEAKIAAEELSRATEELVEAGLQQWDEANAAYLASLPMLCFNSN